MELERDDSLDNRKLRDDSLDNRAPVHRVRRPRDDSLDNTSQGHRFRRPRVDAKNPIFRGDARFFPCKQTLDDKIFHMRFPASVIVADVVCSHNRCPPLLPAEKLNISADDNIIGIVYNTDETTAAHLIREYNVFNVGKVRIADAQFSVTGSVGVGEMEQFLSIVASVSSNVEFRNDAMRITHDACGAQKDAFNKMLSTVAQRETFEETGFFSKSDAFEFVNFEHNWAIFKVHASQLCAKSLEECRAFVAQNPQEAPFRTGRIPFKVQVYVYGTRHELRDLIGTIQFRPAVERDIAGLVLYKAGEIEQFRVV
jgi:hypothetical protein